MSTQPPPGNHHRVYKAMIRPLTLMGVERRLFFLALLLGAATFNLFYSLLAGILIFALVYGIARVCGTVDAQMLPIVLKSVVDRARCEGKRDCVEVCPYEVFEVRRIDDADYTALSFFVRLRVLAHRKQSAYTPRADACQACGLCLVACPEEALRLVPV